MTVKKYLLVFLLFPTIACCSPPKIELCIHNGDGSAECTDPREDPGQEDYHKEPEELENHVSTNPVDFNTLIEACQRWKND